MSQISHTKMIKKAIIPIAGRGSRMYPVTTVLPKAMLPILNKPVIHYILEDMLNSGIQEIYIIKNKDDNITPSYVTRNFVGANIKFITQSNAYGNAVPLVDCHRYLCNEPVLYYWGDSLILHGGKFLASLLELAATSGGTVLTVSPHSISSDYKKYGFVSGVEIAGTIEVTGIIEKPKKKIEGPHWAIQGPLILDPKLTNLAVSLFKCRDYTQEFSCSFILGELLKVAHRVFACKYTSGFYVDVGNNADFAKAQIIAGLHNPDIAKDISKYLYNLKLLR